MNQQMKVLLEKVKVKVWHSGAGMVNDTAFEIIANMIIDECDIVIGNVPVAGPGSAGCGEILRKHFGVDL